MSRPARTQSIDEIIDELTQRKQDDAEIILRLIQALQEVVLWSSRAEDERQQSGPVLRDYLAHAADAARKAINSVPIPASA